MTEIATGRWMIIELMSDHTAAGFMTVEEIACTEMIRLDVPVPPSEDNPNGLRTTWFHTDAIHSMHPVSEEQARLAMNAKPYVPDHVPVIQEFLDATQERLTGVNPRRRAHSPAAEAAERQYREWIVNQHRAEREKQRDMAVYSETMRRMQVEVFWPGMEKLDELLNTTALAGLDASKKSDATVACLRNGTGPLPAGTVTYHTKEPALVTLGKEAAAIANLDKILSTKPVS